MTLRSLIAFLGAVFLTLSLSAHAAPKISQSDARKAALQRVPGTVVHEKLKETKKGHEVYSFKIKAPGGAPGVLKKVEIDAETGAVVKVKDVKAKVTQSDD